MEEWKEYKLGDLIVLSSGGTPNKSNSSYWDGGIPWISAKAMYDDYLYSSDMTITKEGLDNGSKLAPVNSILLLTRGSGLFNRIPICLVKREMAFNQDVKCIESRDKNVVSTIFLFYWLMGNRREISNILETTGIGAGKIDTERLKKIHINLPPIQMQQVLIKFAESLMLKIEVNRRINENLELQAQALFKSWFVEFEPFKDGEFVESELGMIPKGWKVIRLSEIIEIPKKSINPSKNPESHYYHYSIPAYDNGMRPDSQIGKEILSNKFIVGDKMTLFSKLNPRIRRIWFVDNVAENSICSTEFVPYSAKNSELSAFVYSVISSQNFYDFIMSMVNGATGSHQRFHPEESLLCMIPFNNKVTLDFNKIIEPILSKMLKNRAESQRLIELRDTLLPRLMSGEIKVEDVTL
jgi:type I restriction enzyme S subunit